MLKLLHLKNNLLFLFLLFEILAYGQQYPSINYDVTDGLPTNSVRTILKTSNGVIWIGTDSGIAKLENGRIKRFIHPKLPIAKVWELQQSKDGAVWVGTYGKGIFKIFKDEVTNYNTDSNLTENRVRKIYVKDDVVLVGTENGVSIIDNKNITNLKLKETEKFRLQVQDFFEYKNEVYVVSYRAGLFKIIDLKESPKLIKLRDYYHAFATGFFDNKIYHSVDGKIKTYTISDFINGKEETSSFGTSIAWDYVKTNKEKIYTASWGVHTKNGGVYTVLNDEMVLENDLLGINSHLVWGLTYDSENGFLYVATLDKGLYKVDISGKIKFIQTKSKVENIDFIEGKKVVVTDKKMEVFTSSDTLIFSYKNFNNYRKNKLNLKPSYLKEKNYVRINRNNSEENFNLNSLKIYENNIWISTNIGIYKLSKIGQFLDYFPIHNKVFSFAPNGDLICPEPYSGVAVYKNSIFENRVYFESKSQQTPVDVNHFFKHDKTLYIVSPTRGLFTYTNQKFENIYKTDELTFATPKNDNIFYLANNTGKVLEFSLIQNKIIKTLDNKRFKGQSINFLKYYNESLIIGTEKGINILKDGSQILIDEEQGLNDIYVQNLKMYNNKMFVGTNSGYYEVDLDFINTSYKKIFKTSINNLDINFEKYTSKVDEPIFLNYNENNINVSWTTIRHPYPKKLEYSYRINSLDTNWVRLKDSKLLLPFMPSGNHLIDLKIKDLHFGTTYNQQLLEFNISKPFWWKWWFLLLIILITSTITYLYLKKKANRKRKIIAIEKRITETKLEVLQSQMNPHFTFNAMNSIHHYIIDNDVDNALFFLSEFSKLMRATLNFSSKQKITLEEELEYINRYVLLENMRFGNNVAFKVEVRENIGTSEIYLLPMILQPFLENCFEHAFHKNSINPTIILKIVENNNLLIFTITDNGQGVKERNSAKLSTSKGIKLVKERLQLIQDIKEPVTIKSSNNGTFVTITLQNNTLTNSI